MPFNKVNYNYLHTDWVVVGADIGGVYGITDVDKKMIYIGETENFRRRLPEHRSDTSHKMHQYHPHYVLLEAMADDELARLFREKELIAEYDPPANSS